MLVALITQSTTNGEHSITSMTTKNLPNEIKVLTIYGNVTYKKALIVSISVSNKVIDIK